MRHGVTSLLLLLALLLAFPSQAAAQRIAATQPGAGQHLRVFLLTMGPGDAVWEKFGHNALWIHDAAEGTDLAYNWGVFDFDTVDFFRRFIFGTMRYWLDFDDANRTVAVYQYFDRSVYVQELNLTPRQKQALQDYVRWNARPENKYYQYDYYRDNCSTRVRDVLDLVTGGRIKAQLADLPAGQTYRTHTRRIIAEVPPLYAALLYILGPNIDQPISAWQESFLPLQLMDHLRTVQIEDDAGQLVPLVGTEFTQYESARPPLRDRPPTWWPWFLAIGLATAALFVALARLARTRTWARRTFLALATLWSLFVGLLGLFAVWAWGFTWHWSTYRNENILQYAPFAIALLFTLPRARRPFWLHLSRYLALAVLAFSLAGLLLKVLPAFDQYNLPIILWMLPAHAGLAAALYALTPPPSLNPEP